MLQVGDVLVGRYEIEALLGEGGMGAVFRTLDALNHLPGRFTRVIRIVRMIPFLKG